MYTPEFEKWWTRFCVDGHLVATNTDATTLKRATWLAWRTGREKLNEELIHLRLQPAKAA